MYLIHVHLRPDAESGLPDQTGAWVRAAALPEDQVEHVSVHSGAEPYPVVGLHLLADRLEDAEARAEQVCARALAAHRELRGWSLTEAQAPLVGPFYEGLLDGSAGPGRKRPGPFPSS